MVFSLLALLTLLAFFDAAGSLGKIVAKISGLLLGSAAVAAPLIFFGIAVALLLPSRKGQEEEPPASNLRVYLGAVLFSFALTGILHLLAMRSDPSAAFELVKQSAGGGYLGVLAALPLFSLVDFWAALVILAGLVLVSVVVVFNLNLAGIFRRSKELLVSPPAAAPPATGSVKINKMEAPGFNVAKVLGPPVLAREAEQEDQSGEETGEDETLLTGPKEETMKSQPELAAKYRRGNWQLPPLDLLEEEHSVVNSGNIEANVEIIQKTLRDFGIEVEMGEVNIGPTVTQYTLRPAQGIKLSQIMTLQNDLALALAATAIRIEAPIPGKSLVGIEVPNKTVATVRIKDIVQTDSFVNHHSNLAFALGRDVAGHPVVADLAKMPHLLIAGATGTGKSVAINSLLISFLYRNSPEELQLMVIDPKRVELNLYNGVPHLKVPVIIDYDKAVNALKWAVAEMDRRYNLLAKSGKRNIIEYNSTGSEPLPYIVVVVDELADLMAVAQIDVEAAVVRLAQMARAVGVHLVLATQRPSVDIITGLIKANITARIAFTVASQVDSRTILDMAGAEKLLGSGDMLYVTAELSRPKRIQGTYISEKEVRGVVEFLQQQAGDVEYDETVLEKPKAASSFSGFPQEDQEEDLLAEAEAMVRRTGKASATLLQRHLRIGYARAARLLDLLEQKEFIGPADGAKPRDVYIGPAEEYNDKDKEA